MYALVLACVCISLCMCLYVCAHLCIYVCLCLSVCTCVLCVMTSQNAYLKVTSDIFDITKCGYYLRVKMQDLTNEI